MIVTVTPNPALDLTWHVAALQPGSTHRADTGQARAGGKGVNVARVAHAEGASACAVVTHGGATGEEFFAELVASGVPHVTVPVHGATRRSIALVDETAGDTTIVNERGAALEEVEWDVLRRVTRAALAAGRAAGLGEKPARLLSSRARDLAERTARSREEPVHPARYRALDGMGGAGFSSGKTAVPGAGVLVISGSFPPDTPDDVLPSLIGLGRNAGATVIVDTSGPALLAAADAGASVLKPNEHELRDATGLDDPVDGARELIRRGAELVLLSLGADGMLAVTPTASGDVHVLHARLGEVLAGNPTGAGDAAVAACAVLMDAGIHDPEQILRRATAWSAAAVLMPLAGEIHPSWPELESALTFAEKPLPARDTRTGEVSHVEADVSPASDPKETR